MNRYLLALCLAINRHIFKNIPFLNLSLTGNPQSCLFLNCLICCLYVDLDGRKSGQAKRKVLHSLKLIATSPKKLKVSLCCVIYINIGLVSLSVTLSFRNHTWHKDTRQTNNTLLLLLDFMGASFRLLPTGQPRILGAKHPENLVLQKGRIGKGQNIEGLPYPV